MTVPQIKVKVVRKAQIKVKTLVNFPANVVTQNFLTVTNSGGTYTLSVNFSVLTAGPITDPTTSFVAVQDQSSGIYRTVSVASLLTSSVDADLQAIAALTGAGVLSRTGTNTWALRTITGTANEITVTNGDGVAGNETLSLPASLTFTGKTVTGGTFNSPALVTPALGTPASGVATNLTGTAAGLTAGNATLAATVTTNANMTGDVTSVGNATTIGANKVTRAMQAQGVARSIIGVTGNATANVADIQGTASQFLGVNSAGTALAFQTMSGDATMSGPAITIAANAVTNAKMATMAAWTFKGNATSGAAVPTDVTIAGLANKASPAASDLLLLWDVAGSAWKNAAVSGIAGAGAVSSIAGNVGAFTLSNGLTNSTNDIRLASQPAFAVRLSANQTGVVSGTPTKILYDTATYNVGSFFDTATNHRWTPPAGTIALNASMYGTGTIASGSSTAMFLYKNGAQAFQINAFGATGSGFANGTFFDRANGTDFYEVFAYITTTSGTSTLSAATAPLLNYFQGYWISP